MPEKPGIAEQIKNYKEKVSSPPENLDEVEAIIATDGELDDKQVAVLEENLESYKQYLADLDEGLALINGEDIFDLISESGKPRELFKIVMELTSGAGESVGKFKALVSQMESLIPEPPGKTVEELGKEFAELLNAHNEAEAGPEKDEALAAFMALLASEFLVLKAESESGPKKKKAKEEEKLEEKTLTAAEKKKKVSEKKYKKESFEDINERLVAAAQIAQGGRKGIKGWRKWARVRRKVESFANADVSREMARERKISNVLSKSMSSIKTELALRNTFDDLATSKDGLQSLKSEGHEKDILAFAKFLVEVGLMDKYDGKGLKEDRTARLKSDGKEVDLIKDKLVERYELALEEEKVREAAKAAGETLPALSDEGVFMKHIIYDAPFFAEILGGKAIDPSTIKVEKPETDEGDEETKDEEERKRKEAEEAKAEEERKRMKAEKEKETKKDDILS